MTALVYRLLLLAYPAEFRRRFAGDMTDAFLRLQRERWQAGGIAAVAAFWARTVTDVAVNAGAARADARRAERDRQRGKSMLQLWNSFVQDLRYALRTMRRAPGLTAAVVITLALGIGASSAIASLVRAVIFRPLPYASPEQLLTIWTDAPIGAQVASGWLGPRLGERTMPIAIPMVADIRTRSASFATIAAFSNTWEMTLTGNGEAAVVQAIYVSDGLLQMLGLAPRAGRDFTPQEHLAGAARAALVSQGMWRRLGAAGPPDGRTIQLNGEPYAVIGILPEAAALPATPGDIWIPSVFNQFAQARQVPLMTVLARLKPATSLQAAREQLKALALSLERDFPDRKDHGLALVALSDRISRRSRPILFVLVASVVLLIAIAVVNVANLLLARASGRQREIAVRAALGAGRSRIVRQVLTESILLAFVSAAAGVLMAWWTLGSLVTLLQNDLPPGAGVRVDGFVLAVTGIVAFIAGLAFGVAPAMVAARSGAADALRHGARAGTGGRRMRQVLVTIEVALAFVLLTSSGLLLRSFWRLTEVDPGFRTQRMVSVPLGLPQARYPSAAQRVQFYDRLLAETRALPGIENAALVNRLPLSQSANNAVTIQIEGREAESQATNSGMNVDRRIGSTSYFETMGIPVIAGRTFEPADAPASTPIAVINNEMARRFWPDGDAIGARARIQLLSGPGPWLTIVGVVGNVRHHGLDADVRPELWVPYSQAAVNGMVLVASASVDPESLIPSVRRTVQGLDTELPVTPSTLSAVVTASVAAPRSRTTLLSAFAAVALMLATVGIAGVVAYTVSRMTRDIGVRLALGADRRDILRLVLRQALSPTLAGLAIGIAAALVATRALATLLFEITPSDPLTFVSVAAGLLTIATLASLVPARRAMRVDPVSVLRVE
jgi:putative ABC transport system permease protein